MGNQIQTALESTLLQLVIGIKLISAIYHAKLRIHLRSTTCVKFPRRAIKSRNDDPTVCPEENKILYPFHSVPYHHSYGRSRARRVRPIHWRINAPHLHALLERGRKSLCQTFLVNGDEK